MKKLFGEKKIEDYFNQIKRNIQNEIDNYTEHYLATLDIDECADKLYNRFKITVPTLDKASTATSITTKQIEGHEFPSGTRFVPGQIYEIEVANYKIPFTGDKNIFECCPTTYSGVGTPAEISDNHILFQLTNWGKISGNDTAIDELKNEALRRIEKIEQSLSSAERDCEQFNDQLVAGIKGYLTPKVEHIKSQRDSGDKLNPFK